MKEPNNPALQRAWMIVSGEYSNYQVAAVCLDETTAQAWVQDCNNSRRYQASDEYRLEEVYLIPESSKPYTDTLVEISVVLHDDGTNDDPIISIDIANVITRWQGITPDRPIAEKFYRYRQEGGTLRIKANSLDTAQKVLSEQLAMWKSLADKSAFWS